MVGLRFKPETIKFLKYGLGFAVFFVTIAFSLEKTLAFFVSKSNDAQTGKINLVMGHRIDPEIMIFGSSVSEVGFNPDVLSNALNKTVYNASLDGTIVIKSEFLVDEFLSYSKSCKTLLIGLSFFSFTESSTVTEPQRFIAHKNNRYVRETIRLQSNELYKKLYYAPFYSFIVAKHTYYKNAAIGFENWVKDTALVPDSTSGFVGHNASYFDTSLKNEKLDVINISDKTIEQLSKLIKKIKSHHITPILVINPMHRNGQNSFSNYPEFILKAKALATASKINLLDFSDSHLVNDTSFFYNNGHLNKNGANIFSHNIADSLKLIYRIRDTIN